MSMPRSVSESSRAVLRRKAVRLYCGNCFRNSVMKAPVLLFQCVWSKRSGWGGKIGLRTSYLA